MKLQKCAEEERNFSRKSSCGAENLSDFALFLTVMKDPEAHRIMLSIIAEEELQIRESRVEDVVLNQKGRRSIRLDAWARDEKGRQYDTEMQNDAEADDLRRRSRYYQGLLDSPALKSGKQTRYRHLPETTIIFITQEDFFGKDRAQYTFYETCGEEGFPLGDGTTKIFLNMESLNGSEELVSLLQYMKDSRLDNPQIPAVSECLRRLDAIVQEVKQSEEWEETNMSIYRQGIEVGVGLSVTALLSEIGKIPETLQKRIAEETDLDILKSWIVLAAKANSVEEFEKRMTCRK